MGCNLGFQGACIGMPLRVRELKHTLARKDFVWRTFGANETIYFLNDSRVLGSEFRSVGFTRPCIATPKGMAP